QQPRRPPRSPPVPYTTLFRSPAAVANRIGFKGNYKQEPEECLRQAERYLTAQGIKLDFSEPIRKFCLEYRTTGKSKDDSDPDGADRKSTRLNSSHQISPYAVS